MAYDPEFSPQDCTTLSHAYAAAAVWQKIPGIKEPELKIAVDDPSNFAGVFSYLVSENDVYVSPKIIPVDYFLLSLSVDTLDRRFHSEELQLRARGNLTYDADENFSQFDVCVKTLLSSTEVRNEVESCEGEIDCVENYYSQFIDAKRTCPIKNKELSALPSSLHDIKNDSLFVEAVCVTSRNNFYLIVEIGAGVFARVEATADQNMFLTPHTDIVAGEDNEMEFEVKEIGAQKVLTDQEINDYSEAAMEKLRIIIQDEFPDILVNEKSKIERASDAVMHTYHQNNHGLQSVSQLQDLGKIAARQWPVYQKVTVAEVLEIDNHLPMWELVISRLKPPHELLDNLQNDLSEIQSSESVVPFKKCAVG